MAKWNAVTLPQNLESSSNVDEVYEALSESGANHTHIALAILAANVVKRKGAFATSLPKVSVSFMDMHQGAAYYYIVLYFIWGVEHGHYKVPGLESEEIDGVSNLTKVKKITETMYEKCVVGLEIERLPKYHFYDQMASAETHYDEEDQSQDTNHDFDADVENAEERMV
jgi:hypothetical protein